MGFCLFHLLYISKLCLIRSYSACVCSGKNLSALEVIFSPFIWVGLIYGWTLYMNPTIRSTLVKMESNAFIEGKAWLQKQVRIYPLQDKGVGYCCSESWTQTLQKDKAPMLHSFIQWHFRHRTHFSLSLK